MGESKRRMMSGSALDGETKPAATGVIMPGVDHLAFRDDCVAVLSKHAGRLSAPELLALASNLVGQIITMQDQRTMTREEAFKIVTANIEVGYQSVVNALQETVGNA